MRRFIIVGGLLFGICLMLASGLIYRQNQQSPTLYRLLYDRSNLKGQTLFWSLPDGRAAHPIIHARHPIQLAALDWLADGETLLYQRFSPKSGYQLLTYEVRSGQSTLLADSVDANSSPRWRLVHNLINDLEWRLITMRSDEGQAIYRINRDGQILERISPYHATIQTDNMRMTDDGEWLFYQATKGTDWPNVLFRLRLDGSEHLELFQFEGTLAVWTVGDVIDVSLNIFGQVQPINYQITVVGDHVEVTETERGMGLAYTSLESGWTIFNDFSGFLDPPGHVYRQASEGGELEHLLGEGQQLVSIAKSHEAVFYVETVGNFEVLKVVDVPTLSRYQLTPDNQFLFIRSVQSIGDPDFFAFEGIQANQQALYRINRKTGELQQLMTFDHPNLERFYYSGVGDWMLATDLEPNGPYATTTVFLVNTKTRESHQIFEFPYDTSYMSSIHLPDPDMLILSVPADTSAAYRQFYVNLSEGVSQPVHIGNDVVSGKFKLRQLNTTLTLGIGLTIMTIFGLAGFIERQRQATYRSPISSSSLSSRSSRSI